MAHVVGVPVRHDHPERFEGLLRQKLAERLDCHDIDRKASSMVCREPSNRLTTELSNWDRSLSDEPRKA